MIFIHLQSSTLNLTVYVPPSLVYMSNKTILAITPSLLLKKVNPIRLLEEYKNKKYVTMHLPHERVCINKFNGPDIPLFGSSPEDEIYTFRDKNNALQTIVTTNHKKYTLFKTNGTEPSTGGTCQRCKVTFSTECVGIPVRMEERLVPIGTVLCDSMRVRARDFKSNRSPKSARAIGLTESKTDAKIYIFYIDGEYCSFECALSSLKEDRQKAFLYRNPIYMDSEQLLHYLYSLMHPESPRLMEALDLSLYKVNHGPFDYNDIKTKIQGRHKYIRTPNVILAPVKIQYLRVEK